MNYDLFKKRQKSLSYMSNLLDDKYEVFNNYIFYKDILSLKDFKSCKNKDVSRAKKRSRCYNKYFTINVLAKLTRARMVFGTITLNDNFLSLNEENQKKNIQYYLKKHFFYVIKNKDYGSKNDRLHYHFIGLSFEEFISSGKKSKKGRDMYNIKNDNFKWGFVPNYEFIEYNCLDAKKISNYLVKLNNHSNKISVRKSRLSILKNKDYLKKYCTFADCII